jgi:hypothetical protein
MISHQAIHQAAPRISGSDVHAGTLAHASKPSSTEVSIRWSNSPRDSPSQRRQRLVGGGGEWMVAGPGSTLMTADDTTGVRHLTKSTGYARSAKYAGFVAVQRVRVWMGTTN